VRDLGWRDGEKVGEIKRPEFVNFGGAAQEWSNRTVAKHACSKM